MSLVVAKKIKDIFKEKGLRTSEAAVVAVNKELEKVCMRLCDQAADKVVADKLKTVKPGHIPNMDSLLHSGSTDSF